jgi:hypothetical protein
VLESVTPTASLQMNQTGNLRGCDSFSVVIKIVVFENSNIDRNVTDYLGQRQEFSSEKRLLFMASHFILKK